MKRLAPAPVEDAPTPDPEAPKPRRKLQITRSFEKCPDCGIGVHIHAEGHDCRPPWRIPLP